MLVENLSDSYLIPYNFISNSHKYFFGNIYHLVLIYFSVVLEFPINIILVLFHLFLRLVITIIWFRLNFRSRRLFKIRLFVCFYDGTIVVSRILLNLGITAITIHFFRLLDRLLSVLIVLFQFFGVTTLRSSICRLNALFFDSFLEHCNQHFVFHFFYVLAS